MKNIYLLCKNKFDKYTMLICFLCLVYLFVVLAGVSSIAGHALLSQNIKVNKTYKTDILFIRSYLPEDCESNKTKIYNENHEDDLKIDSTKSTISKEE